MNFLSLENISKSFGIKTLFKHITFGVAEGERVALVAQNGAGKSTLLNIIMGEESADDGIIALRKEIRTIFLPQDPKLNIHITVIDELFSGDTPMLQAINAYEHAINAFEHNMTDATSDALEKAQQTMDDLQAWDYEHKAKQILSVLGIDDYEQKVGGLSGGQIKRVALAKALIQQPDFLILDEPTNHLDMEMVTWLEDFLQAANITLLMVTHDRYFLDRVCNVILELGNGQLYRHNGNYSYYVEKKAERELQLMSETDKAKNLYKTELDWVRRMPKARGTKSKARLGSFEILKEKALRRTNTQKVEMSVKTSYMGTKILEAHNLKKSYGDKVILSGFDYTFKRGEKVGIVGRNGMGKSTLLNLLMGLEEPDGGKVVHGESIVFGYFTQSGIKLDDDRRVIDVIKDIAEFIPMANGTKLSASQLLTRFLFTPETQYNYVSVLSGGEKRRLYLLTILVKNPNFLVLDEPTNDLDITTLSILEDFLVDFSGCVLVVSHDRYFMDRIVEHTLIFEGNGEISDFPGNVSEYLEYADIKKDEEKQARIAEQQKAAAKPVQKVIVVEKENPATGAKKPSFKEQQEYDKLENEIAEMETKKSELEQSISLATHTEVADLSAEYQKLISDIEKKSARWLELAELFV